MIDEVYIDFENKLSSKLAVLTKSDKKIVNSSRDFENFKSIGKSFQNVRLVDKHIDNYIFYQIVKQKFLSTRIQRLVDLKMYRPRKLNFSGV